MTLPTLDAIYPPATFLAPRREDDGPAWAPTDRYMAEFMTGNLIACAGRLPLLVQKGAMSPLGLATMERCGVEIGAAIEVYETLRDYELAIDRRLRRGERIAYVHFPASGRPDRAPALVGSEPLRFLNNKSNVARLAGSENVPARRAVDLSNPDDRGALTTPIVLKIASNETSSGGLDIALCLRRRHLRRALARFAGAKTAIAESFVDAARNWCVQYGVLPDGEVREMGASEQVCLRNGVHAGNLLDLDRSPPAAAVSLGRAIAMEGSRLGFRGVCGFDILVDRQERPYAIDLNFRPVSSTAFVYEMMRRKARSGAGRLARLAFCRYDGALDRLIRRCGDGLDEGWLLPLATFDPDHGGLGSGPARMRLAILADDRRTLHRREALLASRGIDFFRTPTRWDDFRARFRAMI